jgi:photosystem II stability/assembly factor-like uncharacterized protein
MRTTLFLSVIALWTWQNTLPAWTPQTSGTAERLRAVSAVSETVAWASGNNGTVVRTSDGGATWTRVSPPGTDTLDFRDIEAVDATTAYILSIGPADRSRILKTTDAGQTWTPQFTNADPRAFYDAVAFWDARRGLAVGDPVDGHHTVVRTEDGGRTWTPVPAANLPPALEGEGAFAASGTCLVVQGVRNAWIGTGGAARARVFRSHDGGLTWKVADTPIMAGVASAGIFSLAFTDERNGVAVGGDYRKEGDTGDNIAFTADGGATWTMKGATRLRGFRSAVAYVPGSSGRHLMAVGPAGSDESSDGGATWSTLGDDGYHAFSLVPVRGVVRQAQHAPTFLKGAGWAVGEQGRIGKRGPR